MFLRCMLLATTILLAALPAFAQPRDLTVFAAASLKNALDEAAAKWTAGTAKKVRLSYAASSALARQIEAGAPADVFMSADLDWMDYLAGRNLLRPATRADLFGNRLVLIANRNLADSFRIAPGALLPLGDSRLALANVEAVPAGKYAKAALQKLGLWESVAGRLAQAENVRAALLMVARGEARLGIVYRTDAAADDKVRILDAFPDGSHPPIVYPIAVTATSTNPDAEAFVLFLRSPAARAIFEKQGFTGLE
jgi:molybdate transport system substrate-binding protein